MRSLRRIQLGDGGARAGTARVHVQGVRQANSLSCAAQNRGHRRWPSRIDGGRGARDGGRSVTVYDRMPSPGRKFLLAGRGGLNLTHSEEFERLLARYGPATPRLRAAIEAFPPRICGRGARVSARRHSSDRAGGCFPKPSRPRRCCARGSSGSTQQASISGHAITGPDGTPTAPDLRRSRGTRDGAGRRDSAGAGRRELAASRLRRRLGRLRSPVRGSK